MPPPPLTHTTVALLELLLEAFEQNRDLDGWQLMKALRRSGPAVYAVLDRLERAGWVKGEFEQRTYQGKPQPRRRFYRLTGIGVEAARAEVARDAAALPVLRPRLGLHAMLRGEPA